MAKTQILEYTVWLRDAALVATLQAQIADGPPGPVLSAPLGPARLLRLPLGGYGVAIAPYYAGIEFDLAAGGTGGPPGLPQIESGAPVPATGLGYITSPWFTPDNGFPRTLYTFTISEGWWIFGSETTFIWAGKVALAPGAAVTIGVPSDGPGWVGPVPYIFVHGEAAFDDGEVGGVGGGAAPMVRGRCPGAGRGDGLGMRFATDTTTSFERYSFFSADDINPPLASYPAGVLHDGCLREMWQRLYIRPIRYGSATVRFWQAMGAHSYGFSLGVTSSGQFALFANTTSDGTQNVLLQTFGQTTLGQWTRLDLFCHYPDPPSKSKSLEIRVNGVLSGQGSRNDLGVLADAADRGWGSTECGTGFGTDPASDAVIDLDDWTCAAMPPTVDAHIPAWNAGTTYAVGDVVRQGGLTYVATAPSTGQTPAGVTTAYWQLLADASGLRQGTHLVRVTPHGFGPGHSGWTGDWRVLGQRAALLSGVAYIESAVPNAPLHATLPMAEVIDARPDCLGWLAARVILAMGKTAPALSGTLGYQLGTDPAVLLPITSDASVTSSMHYDAITVLPPAPPVTGQPLTLRYTKGNDAEAVGVGVLVANVLCTGIFGPEDVVAGGGATLTHRPPATVHLCEHPESPWARGGLLAAAPVIIVGGTYTGNGTGQDLLFKVPPTFWLVRRIATGGGAGGNWWAGMIAAHRDFTTSIIDTIITGQARDYSFVPTGPTADQQQQYRVQIAGTIANAIGVDYQYIAFCDPAARFSRAFSTKVSPLGSPRDVPLDEPSFTGEVAFVALESSLGVVTPDLAWKGRGHAADAVQPMGSSTDALANALTFGTGRVTIGPGLFVSGSANIENIAGLLFRPTDGNTYTSPPPVYFTGTYVGDGAASRTITMPPVGRRPLWAQVQAIGGTTYQRDPSHTGTTSSNAVSNASTATAITAGGLDSFTVGSTLNTNGVTFNYFGFYAGTTACNNGWGCNGEYVLPIETPLPPPYVPPFIPPVPPGPGPGPGGPGPGLPEDVIECPDETHRLVNLALQRLGVNTPIADVLHEASAEAEAVRLAYEDTLQETLVRLPWPFATRTAPLALLEGTALTPVNADWQYAYALPGDCLFPRRLVTARGAAADPTPPPFRLGYDQRAGDDDDTDEQTALYTNQADALLEYTARVLCPAKHGDATFRSAWAWRLASAIAPPLTRMADRVQHCLELWEFTVEQGRLVLRLGAPGLRPAATTSDPDAGTPAMKLAVVNTALLRIGAQTIADLTTEQSREAVAVLLAYEHEYRMTLRDFPWGFATRYANPLVWVAGACEAPAEPDWTYSTRAPAEMLFARRLVRTLPGGVARAYDPAPPQYRVGSDATGLLIYTHESPAVLEYTVRVPIAQTDDGFKDALAWRLAAALAPSIGRPDPARDEQRGRAPRVEAKDPRPSEGGTVRTSQLRQEQARWAWAMYQQALLIARVQNANEQQPAKPGEAEWITGR